MQEKVSAIIPPTPTDDQIVLNLIEENQPLIADDNQTQEEISTIIPSILTDNQIVLNLIEESQPLIADDNQTQENELVTDNLLDQLALDVVNSIDIEITGNSTLVTTAIDVGKNWEMTSKENEILETAKEFLGVKYIWAANGPTAFDCSGYTKYVFRQNGITLPRYSGHQAKIGIKVDYDELEKGDLVFFDTAKHSTGRVNHVGIFIGNNKFIHASSGGKKVMITSFNQKKFYKNRFLHGQRVVNADGNVASLRTSSNNSHI